MAFEGNKAPSVDLADLKGSVKFSFEGGSYNVRFNYAAVAKLQAIYGEDFIDIVGDAINKKKITAICAVMSIATDIDREQIMETSPPIIPAITALDRAWAAAWHGSAIQTPMTDEEEEEEGDGKKRNGLLTLWRKLGSWLFARG